LQFENLADGFENESWMPEPMVEEPDEIQIESQTNNARRRRDYTKEEKDVFEQWITSNPKPDKKQKTAYTKLHGLTDGQLQNLINNRRRRKNTPGSKVLGSDGAAHSQILGRGLPQSGRSFDLTETMSFEPMEHQGCCDSTALKQPQFEIFEAAEIYGPAHQEEEGQADADTLSLPVSNSNLLQVLSKKPSYSSIEEYLKSPEEAVPFESIRRASTESHRPDLSIIKPPMPPESSHRASTESHRPDLSSVIPPMSSPLDEPLLYAVSVDGKHSWINSIHNPWRGGKNIGFLSVPNVRSRQNSLDSTDGHDTASTFGSTDSFVSSNYAGSFASSVSGNSRIRTKKMRRQRHMSKRIAFFSCAFCSQVFKTREEMIRHETDTHCLPQTFPCTLCEERFDTMDAWEDHENEYHCQPQITWFCMLDGKVDVHHCLFCGELAPFRTHYEEAHDLHPCDLSLTSRTFSTRYEIMRHLVKVHQMTEDEVSFIKDGLDVWSVKLNMGYSSGLWGCGYCGVIGADWDHRLIHIKNHWHDGGPRMTKKHPWLKDRANLANLHNICPQYVGDLRRGKPIKERPWNMYFHGFQVYEAAIQHRAKRKAGGKLRDEMEVDLKKPALLSNANPATSFFSHLASRTKMFLSFARVRRKRGQKEET
jgi:hypothetical protein